MRLWREAYHQEFEFVVPAVKVPGLYNRSRSKDLTSCSTAAVRLREKNLKYESELGVRAKLKHRCRGICGIRKGYVAIDPVG
jgi:hypothetical protein